VQKLAYTAQISFAKRALLYNQNQILTKINNEAKVRRFTRLVILGKAKVMSFKDIEVARAACAAKDVIKGKGKRDRKRKSATLEADELEAAEPEPEPEAVRAAKVIKGKGKRDRKRKSTALEADEPEIEAEPEVACAGKEAINGRGKRGRKRESAAPEADEHEPEPEPEPEVARMIEAPVLWRAPVTRII
jgi:hypothetical protein